MSDDAQQPTEDTSPVIIGDPLEPDEMDEQLTVSQADIESAIDWFDIVATPMFVGILEG